MRLLSALLLLLSLSRPVFGEQITLKGTLSTDDCEPVANTRVIVSGGPSDMTDASGRFQIRLSTDFISGERVILAIEKKGWEINHPLDGVWNLPNLKYQNVHTTQVLIVPHGLYEI